MKLKPGLGTFYATQPGNDQAYSPDPERCLHSLPPTVTAVTSLVSFKRQLKSCLFNCSYSKLCTESLNLYSLCHNQ